MGILLAAAVILFGKLFCAYLCPIGSIEDLLSKLRKSIGFASQSADAVGGRQAADGHENAAGSFHKRCLLAFRLFRIRGKIKTL